MAGVNGREGDRHFGEFVKLLEFDKKIKNKILEFDKKNKTR